jgi:DNA-binding transcriptional regulator YhcF (GntR family)
MHFDIRPSSEIPVYEQIYSQIIFVIASGALDSGAEFPSVRDLADQLTVNPNTIARAYKELAERGILEAKRGLGMEVTEQAPAICRAERQDRVRRRVREVLREAVSSALPAQEVERIVSDELHRVNGHRK